MEAKRAFVSNKIAGPEGSSFIQGSENSFIQECELSSVGCIYSVEVHASHMWMSACVPQKTSVEWGLKTIGLLVAFELFSSINETVETKTMCYFLWLAFYFDSVEMQD